MRCEMRDLIRLIEEMDEDLRNASWQDWAIFGISVGVVLTWIVGVSLQWW